MIIAIVSGYFNPLHGGHLDMLEAASNICDKLIVIVNNDKQQLFKKGKIILSQENRVRLISALRVVDEVVLAVDDYQLESGEIPVSKTLKLIAEAYPNDKLIFANGGDRDSKAAIPEDSVCTEYGIELAVGVGGYDKADSSTRINQALGIGGQDETSNNSNRHKLRPRV